MQFVVISTAFPDLQYQSRIFKMSLKLPKPLFDSCDETSLKLKWDSIDVSSITRLILQYKEMHEDWEHCQEFAVSLDNSEGANITEASVVDLKPGTPYFVRLAAVTKDGSKQAGPETVFDTNPIDCTPKQRKCIIC